MASCRRRPVADDLSDGKIYHQLVGDDDDDERLGEHAVVGKKKKKDKEKEKRGKINTRTK